MRLIAGDVGGTKTLLQCVELSGSDRTIVAEQRYESGAFATFDAIVTDFLPHCPKPIDAACFAVAGPVVGGHAETTNLTWKIEADLLASAFSIPHVAVVNDFFAVALGVPLLAPSDLLSLQKGKRLDFAPIAILGAGTGLGEANVVFHADQWSVISSEGGHADFAPQDEEQADLLLSLRARYGHVSWERLLSGMGLVNIYNFLTGGSREYDDKVPAEIAALADRGDAAATRTFEIFVDIYGGEAGNMALRVLARGGVFVAGGIAAKNTRHFTEGRFIEAFLRKGRFHSLLSEIPVDLITNPKVGLIGAAEMARRTREEG